MHLFTTILFVNGNPVKYDVRSARAAFSLHPTDNSNDFIAPPVLQVK